MQIVRTAKGQWDRKCMAVSAGEGLPGRYGLAVDIGTTTVAAGLYDLGTGMLLNSRQERNRQTVMGADIMMRLMHCRQGKQARLQELIRGQLRDMAEILCAGVCPCSELERMVVVGNTAMCHIFLGLETEGLAGSPFCPAYRGAYRCTGADVGLGPMAGMAVYVVAGVNAHVGADAVAMAAVLGMRETEGVRLAIDIGTNAEIVLSCDGKLAAGSAAAGPAFEGAGISQGMRGGPGAIAAFHIALNTENIILDVIGRRAGGEIVKPCGICGSGLIDAVAALCRCGLVWPDGRLATRQEAGTMGIPAFLCERICPDGFVLYVSDRTDHVMLTQEDIRQFQLAKAAVQAGIRLLLLSRGLSLDQVDQLEVAGVFGGHISVRNAVCVGLFPDIPAQKIRMAGNAAGAGAAQALLSEKFRRETVELAAQAEHMELAEQECFEREFLRAMTFKAYR